MERPELIIPREGMTYRNRNGKTYLCTQYINFTTAVMVRETDGWTLTAHEIRQYLDGTIEWDYSTDGRWPDGKPTSSVLNMPAPEVTRAQGGKQHENW